MRKSKNRYFYHIFVSPGDAPGAITLNVVWMEREFDAYKLSRCICPSNYNRFWDTARYWSKIVIFHTPLHSTPPLGGSHQNSATPFCMEKLEWLGYPMVKKFRRYLYSFWRNSRTWQTDRQADGRTDRHRMPAIAELMHSIALQKPNGWRHSRRTAAGLAAGPSHQSAIVTLSCILFQVTWRWRTSWRWNLYRS